MRNRRLGIVAIVLAIATGVAGAAHAQNVQPYSLAGKTIRVLVAQAAGGNSDQQTRLLVDFMGRHLPGSPNFVVQNLTGASGMIMLQFIAQLDPATDLVMFNSGNSMPFRSVSGTLGPDLFDARTVNWVGGFRGTTQFCIVSAASGVQTIDDMRDRELLFAANAIGSTADAMYTLMREEFGLRITTVAGYNSFGSQVLAVQRNEVQGMCNNYSGYATLAKPAVEAGDARFIFYLGSGPRDDIPDAPYLGDLVTPEAMTFFSSAMSALLFGGPYAIPAGSDPDFVAAMRAAFAAVMADPEFQAAARTYGVDLKVQTPEELAAQVDGLFALSPEAIAGIGRFLAE